MSKSPDKTAAKKHKAPKPPKAHKKPDKLLRLFDLDDPKLHPKIEARALASGGYPYDARLARKEYEAELGALQAQLLDLQAHAQAKAERIVIVFEGRDAAGKGTCIGRFLEHLNTRHARSVALV